MSRLIDVDALGVGRCSKDVLPAAYCAGWNGLINLIEQAPTVDAVPVVRCRECKLWLNSKLFPHSHYCIRSERVAYPDDFCSYGEKKEGADHA